MADNAAGSWAGRVIGLGAVLACALGWPVSSVVHAHDSDFRPTYVDQISGNQADVRQTGAGNTLAIEQRATMSGYAPGYDNAASAVQHGTGHELEIIQQGSRNEIGTHQSGANNSADIGQTGVGLKTDVTQTGYGLSVGVRQYGVGSGAPVTVRQY